MLRLFAALRPPPAVRALLMSLRDDVPGARWQDDEQLHCTVRFIGELERRRAEDVAACLAQVHAPAPVVRLSGVGSFGGHGTQLWAGLAPAEPLRHIHAKADQACRRAGLPPEGRAYLPHVTLARLGRSAIGPALDTWLARHAGLTSEPFPLSHLILYQSVLGREGARYEPVARWPLDRETNT
jgi:RNA 2',3'-cyclic 3'-phosphodiesterase